MKPFSISCTTCQVRLKVRDPSAIGQILTCPKCGSMVLVAAPEENDAAAAASSHDSQAVPAARSAVDSRVGTSPPREEIEGDTGAGAKTEPPGRRPPVPPPRPGSFPAAAVDQSLADDFEQEARAHDEVFRTDVAESPVSGEPLLPDDQWSSAAARQWRQWLLMGGAASTGIFLAGLFFVVVTSRLSDRAEAVSPVDPAEPVAAVPQKVASPDPQTAPLDVPPNELAEKASPGSLPDERDLPESEPAQSVAPEGTPAEAERDESQDNEAAVNPPHEAPRAVEGESETASTTDETPPGLKPPDDPDPAARLADRIGGSGSLSDMLKQFHALLGAEGLEPDGESTRDALPEGDTVEPVDDSMALELPRPEPRDIDIEARLVDTMQAITFDKTPLVDFLRFLTQFSTLPITVHPESLVWLNLTPDQPVSVQMTDARLSDILDSILMPLGLSWAPSDQRIEVLRVDPSPDGLRRVSFDLADMARNAADLQNLADLVVTLVEPGSWESNGGQGRIELEEKTLVVHQREAVLFQILFLCDQLRSARGLPTRSRNPSRHFQHGPLWQRAAPTLARRVTVTFIRPTAFVRIIQELERRVNARFLIDWEALASERWSPDAELTFAALDQSLEATLRELLDPMKLTCRAVDTDVFQITTPLQLEETVELAWYPADHWRANSDSVDNALTQIRSRVGEQSATVAVDPVSRALFVSASPIVHRQLAEDLTPSG